jgi:DNA-binding GntR family transcriptional regulator
MSRKPAATGTLCNSGRQPRGASPRSDGDRTEAIYRAVHAAIVEQRLPPGTRLPEAHLAEVFGVSRTLVRQALQRLVHDHLAIQELNRGVRIAEPSIDEVRQLYEVRRLLECNLLTESGSHLTRARLAALRRTVASETGANASGDTLLAMQLAGTFHLELAAAIGNPVLVDILGELIARGNVALAVYEQRGRALCRCEEHRRILRHLAAGDTAAAAAEMRAHLSAIEESLVLPRETGGATDLRLIFGTFGGAKR